MTIKTRFEIEPGTPMNVAEALEKWHDALTSTMDVLDATEPCDMTVNLMDFAVGVVCAMFVSLRVDEADVGGITDRFREALIEQIESRDSDIADQIESRTATKN